MNTDRWDNFFMKLARDHAEMSKDPSTKIGAVIGHGKQFVSGGYNGFPDTIYDDPEILNDRVMKYKHIVHAEVNAINRAAKIGYDLSGCSLYLWSNSGVVLPCVECAKFIVKSGLAAVVYEYKEVPERWKERFVMARGILTYEGINLRGREPLE